MKTHLVICGVNDWKLVLQDPWSLDRRALPVVLRPGRQCVLTWRGRLLRFVVCQWRVTPHRREYICDLLSSEALPGRRGRQLPPS